MEAADYTYTIRFSVRCKARELLHPVHDEDEGVQDFQDEMLLEEIGTTLFCSQSFKVLCLKCRTDEDATKVAHYFTTELVETYRRIKRRQNSPLVQSLNALL
ncbi:MAG: hypothetical protein MUF49_25155 [Oculatellaceae cyanobacterium Prado106]|nr:hypothetical protein [Oculatellaceae cyanobacterium Prado106]